MKPAHYIAGFDHLRSLAIVLVLLYHYQLFAHPEWIASAGNFGWIGVDLFFVLSGFLIADQLLRQLRKGKISLGAFYYRRAMRILPAYGVMVVLYFLFPVIRERDTIAPLWKFATFTMNLGLDVRAQGTFSHAWSLCVEEHFYLVLPLLLLVCGSWKPKWIAWCFPAVMLLGICLRGVAYYVLVPDEIKGVPSAVWFEWVYYPTPCRLDGLLVGVGIAAAFNYRPHWLQRWAANGNRLFVVGAFLLLFAWWLTNDRSGAVGTLFIFPLVSLGFGAWVLAMLAPNFILGKRSWFATRWLSQLAFTLYLVHKAVYHVAQKFLASEQLPVDGSMMFACCLALSVLAALLLRHLVELPLLRLRDR